MEKTNNNNFKTVLKSPYTLRILWKIYKGYRPSQIAESLNMSQQNLHYYTNQLIDAKLIEKSTQYGLEWKLTNLGQFILKEFLSRSVNRNNSNSNNASAIQQHNTIPIRMHNVTFSFDILSAIDNDKNIRLRWKPINNGVFKCFIRYPDHTLELTKSPNENESVIEVHMSEVYTFDPYQGLLKQYDIARHMHL